MFKVGDKVILKRCDGNVYDKHLLLGAIYTVSEMLPNSYPVNAGKWFRVREQEPIQWWHNPNKFVPADPNYVAPPAPPSMDDHVKELIRSFK